MRRTHAMRLRAARVVLALLKRNTLDEVAALLNVERSTAWRWARGGARKTGGRLPRARTAIRLLAVRADAEVPS